MMHAVHYTRKNQNLTKILSLLKWEWLISLQNALNNIILCLISSSLDKSKRLVPLADFFT